MSRLDLIMYNYDNQSGSLDKTSIEAPPTKPGDLGDIKIFVESQTWVFE